MKNLASLAAAAVIGVGAMVVATPADAYVAGVLYRCSPESLGKPGGLVAWHKSLTSRAASGDTAAKTRLDAYNACSAKPLTKQNFPGLGLR